MIGLALVTLVAVLAAGIVSTFRSAVDDLWKDADYALTAQNNFSPIPVSVAEAAATTPGVETVGSVRAGEAQAFGSVFNATAVDPPTSRIFSLDWKEGSNELLANLGPNGAFVSDGYADDHDLSIGSPVEVTFANGDKRTFRVDGIFDPPTGGSPFGPVTISAATWDQLNAQPRNLYSFVIMDGGQTDANRAALEQRLQDFPNAKVATRDEFVDNQISGLSSRPERPLRAARALRGREPVRDREHARADRLRADARDRDAPRGRHDPAAGAADDPPREP